MILATPNMLSVCDANIPGPLCVLRWNESSQAAFKPHPGSAAKLQNSFVNLDLLRGFEHILIGFEKSIRGTRNLYLGVRFFFTGYWFVLHILSLSFVSF